MANAIYPPKSCMTERFQLLFGSDLGGRLKAMKGQPQQPGPPSIETAGPTIPMGLRLLVMFLRTVFYGALVAMILHVSSPQSETIWAFYENPGDLIMLALGFALCLWIVIHFFMFPKTAEAYRAWVYFGLVVAPLAVVSPARLLDISLLPACVLPKARPEPHCVN
jgi:hypothetical protein